MNDHGTMVAEPSSLALVPTSVTPTWWQFLAVVALVTVAGIGAGWAAGRHVVISPLGLTRCVSGAHIDRICAADPAWGGEV